MLDGGEAADRGAGGAGGGGAGQGRRGRHRRPPRQTGNEFFLYIYIENSLQPITKIICIIKNYICTPTIRGMPLSLKGLNCQ